MKKKNFWKNYKKTKLSEKRESDSKSILNWKRLTDAIRSRSPTGHNLSQADVNSAGEDSITTSGKQVIGGSGGMGGVSAGSGNYRTYDQLRNSSLRQVSGFFFFVYIMRVELLILRILKEAYWSVVVKRSTDTSYFALSEGTSHANYFSFRGVYLLALSPQMLLLWSMWLLWIKTTSRYIH